MSSNKKNIIILGTGEVALKVATYLSLTENIVALYIPDNKASHQDFIEKSGVKRESVYLADNLKDHSHIQYIKDNLQIDYIITIYWPFLLKENFYLLAKKSTINFHPALLPRNRGWYPHVHSLLDGSPCGVTIHQIDKNADTGPIWAQKEVSIVPTDTAFEIYNRLQLEIFKLFKSNWPLIKAEQLQPITQIKSEGNYHKKSEISNLDHIDTSQNYKAEDLINLLKARSFGRYGFAYYIHEDKKVFLKLELSESINFEDHK